jgi:hypothetical protein
VYRLWASNRMQSETLFWMLRDLRAEVLDIEDGSLAFVLRFEDSLDGHTYGDLLMVDVAQTMDNTAVADAFDQLVASYFLAAQVIH